MESGVVPAFLREIVAHANMGCKTNQSSHVWYFIKGKAYTIPCITKILTTMYQPSPSCVGGCASSGLLRMIFSLNL